MPMKAGYLNCGFMRGPQESKALSLYLYEPGEFKYFQALWHPWTLFLATTGLGNLFQNIFNSFIPNQFSRAQYFRFSSAPFRLKETSCLSEYREALDYPFRSTPLSEYLTPKWKSSVKYV